jgi:hypothetical protein
MLENLLSLRGLKGQSNLFHREKTASLASARLRFARSDKIQPGFLIPNSRYLNNDEYSTFGNTVNFPPTVASKT